MIKIKISPISRELYVVNFKLFVDTGNALILKKNSMKFTHWGYLL